MTEEYKPVTREDVKAFLKEFAELLDRHNVLIHTDRTTPWKIGLEVHGTPCPWDSTEINIWSVDVPATFDEDDVYYALRNLT